MALLKKRSALYTLYTHSNLVVIKECLKKKYIYCYNDLPFSSCTALINYTSSQSD